MKVILGNMLFPGFLDHYLARTTFAEQQTKLPVTHERRDNLMHPVRELHRTRGSFGDEARRSALVTSSALARFASIAACGAALLALGMLSNRKPTHRVSRRR
ncbi:hypothetical protein MTX20_35815 [Bradyrhizobium sp. ISRA435]|nr:hypothetical protein MTX20_35815 [Bradyrhizobium sp. ISRA435]